MMQIVNVDDVWRTEIPSNVNDVISRTFGEHTIFLNILLYSTLIYRTAVGTMLTLER